MKKLLLLFTLVFAIQLSAQAPKKKSDTPKTTVKSSDKSNKEARKNSKAGKNDPTETGSGVVIHKKDSDKKLDTPVRELYDPKQPKSIEAPAHQKKQQGKP